VEARALANGWRGREGERIVSTNYFLRCEGCKDESERYREFERELAKAVNDAYPLWLLRKTGWGHDMWTLDFKGTPCNGLAVWIVGHFEHGGFQVVSEYHAARPDAYPPLRVFPAMPGEGYKAIVLERLVEEAKDLAARLLKAVDGP
jgi:hypothetical protein